MTRSAIEADGLVKHFGDTVAVDGVSFAVPEGTVLGLLGPNGAGKTTTIKILMGLIAPTGGTAALFGKPVPHAASREQVGFLPGWFKDTLPAAPIQDIAVLRIDADKVGRVTGAEDQR